MSPFRRRLMMKSMQNINTNCVTQVINPCSFDSTSGRKSTDFVFANLVSGKTYRISIDVLINVTEKSSTSSDFNIGLYPSFHAASIFRMYGIDVGTHNLVSSSDRLCYITGTNI